MKKIYAITYRVIASGTLRVKATSVTRALSYVRANYSAEGLVGLAESVDLVDFEPTEVQEASESSVVDAEAP